MFASTTSENEKWKIINDIRNSTNSNTYIHRLKISFGEIVTNNKKMADSMNYRFSRLGDYFGKNQPQNYCKRNENNFYFRFITSQEGRTQIMNLSVHKLLGPSSIPAWALRDGCSELVEPLTMIFNSFISQSSFPTLFKKTIVTPVYKKDDPENPDNYRPISITRAISKVFEKLLHNQNETYVNGKKLYTPTQFGFRKNFSSIDALLYCTEKF